MHFCRATIALGEDPRNTMVRDEYSPVSWPEVEVIRNLHGEASVLEIIPFVHVRQAPRAERERLALIYGPEALADIWGGKTPPSEMDAPEATLRAGVTWKNPITDKIEVTSLPDAAIIDETPEEDPFDPNAPLIPLSEPKRAAKR